MVGLKLLEKRGSVPRLSANDDGPEAPIAAASIPSSFAGSPHDRAAERAGAGPGA